MGIRKIFLLVGIVATVLFFTRCFQGQTQSDPRGFAYSGSGTCLRCHKTISDSFAHTAHYLSTRIADSSTVAGNFSKDSNELSINETTSIRMEKRDSGLYQVLYINNKETESHRLDLVMGVVKGQTYLYWRENGFFQLPVSYFTALHQWTGSPGYSFADLNFDRPVLKECFGCHSSFANGDPHGFSAFGLQQNSWVFNIDCERCHGPAAAHVQFHDAHPEEKQAMYMVSFRSLSRSQKIDLCAVCHSGTKHILLKSTFAFKMGDSLASYMIPLSTGDQLDVHGNQTQLLSQSKCYRMSDIDCSTCHNAHVNQHGFVKSFNNHCQGCHSPGNHFCKMATSSNMDFLQNNCTSCHMPLQASTAIVVLPSNHTAAIPTMIVNHRIGIYTGETVKIMRANFHDNKTQEQKKLTSFKQKK
jgi:Cytochrome c554 and c-prime